MRVPIGVSSSISSRCLCEASIIEETSWQSVHCATSRPCSNSSFWSLVSGQLPVKQPNSRASPQGSFIVYASRQWALREKFLSCVFCDPEGRFKPSSEAEKCQFWSQTVHQKRSCDVPCDGADSISMLPLADRKRQRLEVARLYAHGARFLLRKLRTSRRIASFLTLSS